MTREEFLFDISDLPRDSLHRMLSAHDSAQRALIKQQAKEIAKLKGALRELHALVKGECPSLLDEDSGGLANLDIAIDELLKEEHP